MRGIKREIFEKKANKAQIQRITVILLGCLAAGYVAVFLYLNLTQYIYHVDSDMGAEALLAREMWNSKSIIPPAWFTSTERRLLSTSLLGALFYGLTHNMQLSIGLSCSVFMLLIVAGYFYMTRQAGMSVIGRLTGLLLIFAFPSNCLLAEGERLPYFTYLFFLYAGYYAPMGAFLFFTLGFYFWLSRDKKMGTGHKILALVLCSVSFALGCSGMRTVEMVLLPLLCADMIRLYRITEGMRKKPESKEVRPTVFTGALLLFDFVGMMLPFSVEYVTKFISTEELSVKIWQSVIPSLLTMLGLSGGDLLKSAGGLIQLCIYCFLVLFVYGLFVFFGKEKDRVSWQGRFLILFFVFGLAITGFSLTVTMIGSSANYFHGAVFLIALSMALLTDRLEDKSPFLRRMLLGFIVCYSILNFKYTYLPCTKGEDNNREWMEAVEWMEREGYEYGYAEFWDANKLTMCANGAVTVAPVTNIASIEPYQWLTSREWFVPALPIQMKTAYIVRRDRRKDFEEMLEYHPGLEECFKNDKFVIYAGNLNYAIIQEEE